MRRLTLSSLSVVALCAALPAQVGPGQIQASQVSTVLTYGGSGQIPGTGVGQICHFRLPGDPAGTWTTCITVTSGLPAANGGVGSYDLLMGTFDRKNGKFTPNLHAANLNSTGIEFGLMLDPTGLHAVFDRATGMFYSSRKDLNSQFGAPVAISGATGTYIDPALGMVGGQLKLFYNLSNNIVMQDFDISTPTAPKVTGSPTIVVPSQGAQMNSATPIHGPDGDVEGLWCAEVSSQDNDMWWKAGLDPNYKPVKVVDTSTWINNGGVAGGYLTHAGPAASGVYELSAAWLLGDTVDIGGQADVFGAFQRQNDLPGVTIVFLSFGLGTPSLQIPGFTGEFGLDLNLFFVLGSMVHTDASDRGTLNFMVPKDNGLKGAVIHLQGLCLEPSQQKFTFTNTARVVVNK